MAEKPESKPARFVCVIYGKEFLDLMLEVFLEVGISGATVIQSQGMGRILSRDFPLFAGFRELLERGGPFNYTVLSVVHDPKLIDQFMQILPGLQRETGAKGVFFTVPVSWFHRLKDLPTGK